ncbi:MAG: T9SS type A sorting domain-containing protein, partial [Elusimicrobia bacterium]|nr:T9SS type A sorting domain-containing protein [Elusimicrobiota bacterium]
LASGDPDQTQQVLFQYRPSSASAWSDLPAAASEHPNPDRDFPYFVQWDVTGLASGSYDLRAVATDVFASSDAAPGFVTVVVDPVNFDEKETDLGGGSTQKQQVMHNETGGTVSAAAPGSGVVSQVKLPAGALSDSTTTLTVTLKPAAAPPPDAQLSSIGPPLEVQLSNGQTHLSGGETASLVFTYPDTDGDGVVDGTSYRADRLEVRSYVNGAWRQESATTVDTKARTLTATTPHFSFFQVFASAAADLSSVRVYPNPYKPDGGSADQGHVYSPSDPVSGIVFDNLPASVEIKIYTVTGKLVTSFGTDNGSGALQWDVRNSDGQEVASGGYFAVITTPGHDPVVKKLGVIR